MTKVTHAQLAVLQSKRDQMMKWRKESFFNKKLNREILDDVNKLDIQIQALKVRLDEADSN